MGATGATRSAGAVRAAGTLIGRAVGVVTGVLLTRGTGSAIGMGIGGILTRGTVGNTCAGLVAGVLTCYLLIAGDGHTTRRTTSVSAA